VPIATPDQKSEELINHLSGRTYDCSSHIVVCEKDKVKGLLTIENLFKASSHDKIASIMDSRPPMIMPGMDQEIAAWKAVKKGESALIVADAEGNFLGLIPPDRLLTILLSEHEEDLKRFGGVLKGTNKVQLTSLESIPRRVWHRLPWLFVGLAGAIFAADIVGRFETQLLENVMLAFFIPSIVYLADAVGTQTETVVVRALSVGIPIKNMVIREFITGIIIGIILAYFAISLVWWRWGEFNTALVVGLSLFAATSVSTGIAMFLPFIFNLLGADPAFGSGPLATVIQDILSILIYFLIAILIF
jgi:magnesium transporter